MWNQGLGATFGNVPPIDGYLIQSTTIGLVGVDLRAHVHSNNIAAYVQRTIQPLMNLHINKATSNVNV